MDPKIILFGLGVGILIGITGAGGGSLMTPLLILVAGINPLTAVGTDLAYGAVTKTAGGIKHLRQQTVDVGFSTWMALGSVPAAIAGVFVLSALRHSVPGFDSAFNVALAGVLLLTGVAVLARAFVLPRHSGEHASVTLTRRNKLAAICIGAVVGFTVGATSVGSGSLIAVSLILVFRLAPTRVVGTDVFHAAIILWAAAAAQAVVGNIDYALAATILIGSVPGVWLGSHIAVRVPLGALRGVLAVCVIGSGLALASKAHVAIPTAVIAVVPVLVAGWLVAARLWQRPREPALELER